MGVEPITLDMRAGFVLKAEQRAIPNYWIGGGSEDTVRVAVSPNNVARGFGHVPALQSDGPGVGARAVKEKNGPR